MTGEAGLHTMDLWTRRSFLRKTGAAAATTTLIAPQPSSARGANERVNLAVIGCGGRGVQLGRLCNQHPHGQVIYVCDPDLQRAERAKASLHAGHAVSDLRRILDDPSVDAILIASCDHWHAPASLLACEAGKHVYVEKPCSHNVQEGRLMIEAAHRNRIVMQHGTQKRSSQGTQEFIALLEGGIIGTVLVAKHVNSQKRANIGRHKPSKPPAHVDYDLWVGPAEWRDYQANYVHYNWHWFYNFGTGDIGNDGVHGIDVARWGLGVTTHPSFISGYGSKLYFDDDQEFPDTCNLTFEYPGNGKTGQKRVLIYEQRIWSPYGHDPEGNSTFFYGTKGMATLGRGGARIYSPNNELVRELKVEDGNGRHQHNFLDAIRDRSVKLNCDIETGHLSSSLPHLGNICARTGRALHFDSTKEQILGDEKASSLLGRHYRRNHWATPGA